MAVFLRGNVYHVRAQICGVTIAKSTKTKNKRTAELLEAKWINEVHSQTVVQGRKPLTAEEAIKKFLASRAGTAGHANAGIKLRAFTEFNTKYLHEVKAIDLHAHAQSLVKGGLSVNTVNVSIVYWNAVQNFCNKNGFTAGEKLKRLKGASNRVRFLTDDEVAKLRKELNPGNPHYREKRKAQCNLDFFNLLLATGARENEIATMRLSQIDMAKGTMTIHRSKGGLDTTFKMSRFVTEIVTRRIAADEKPLPPGQLAHARTHAGYLFPVRSKGRYNNEWLGKAAFRARIPHVHCHVLRHTACVQWLKGGLSLVDCKYLLGHRNLASTQIYAHIVPSIASDRVAELLDAAYSE